MKHGQQNVKLSVLGPSQAHKKATFNLRAVCLLPDCPSALNHSFHRGQTFLIFYIENFHYNSVEKIQTGLISDKNIRHFTCPLVLLLGETPLGKNTENIFENRTITSKGLLLRRARMKRLSPVSARPHISLCFVFRRQSCRPWNGTRCEICHRHDYTVASARTGIYRVFHDLWTLLQQVISKVLVIKKVHINMCPILDGYGVMGIF